MVDVVGAVAGRFVCAVLLLVVAACSSSDLLSEPARDTSDPLTETEDETEGVPPPPDVDGDARDRQGVDDRALGDLDTNGLVVQRSFPPMQQPTEVNFANVGGTETLLFEFADQVVDVQGEMTTAPPGYEFLSLLATYEMYRPGFHVPVWSLEMDGDVVVEEQEDHPGSGVRVHTMVPVDASLVAWTHVPPSPVSAGYDLRRRERVGDELWGALRSPDIEVVDDTFTSTLSVELGQNVNELEVSASVDFVAIQWPRQMSAQEGFVPDDGVPADQMPVRADLHVRFDPPFFVAGTDNLWLSEESFELVFDSGVAVPEHLYWRSSGRDGPVLHRLWFLVPDDVAAAELQVTPAVNVTLAADSTTGFGVADEPERVSLVFGPLADGQHPGS